MKSMMKALAAMAGATAVAVILAACGGGGGPGGREARDQVEKLVSALDLYCLAEARYPPSIADAAVVGRLTNLVQGLSFTDPWGNPLGYSSPGPGACEVWSNGPDGRPDTRDDFRMRRGPATP